MISPLYFSDFETQALRMVRVVYREWLRYVTCNVEPWLSPSRFCFLETIFLCKILLAYFRDSGKRNFYSRDPWSSIFSVREPCQRTPHTLPPCTILMYAGCLWIHWFTSIAEKIFVIVPNIQVYHEQESQQPRKRNTIKKYRFVTLPRTGLLCLRIYREQS